MAATQRGLGRGLEALLKTTSDTAPDGGDIKNLPINAIQPNPYQPRRHFSESSLQELATSIRSQGVLQPIIVRLLEGQRPSRYELIAGERRLRASTLAGLDTIPAVIKKMSDEQSLIWAMIENLQREDLNPIDEATGLQSLQKKLGSSQDDLARAVGKSRPAIANALRLLQLPESIQDDLANNRLTAGHARALLGLDDENQQLFVRDAIVQQHLSVRQIEQIVGFVREHGTMPEDLIRSVHKRPQKKSGLVQQEVEPFFKDVQSKLADKLALKVRLQGSREKGKVVLNYSSEEQLHTLLQFFGMDS